MLPIKPLAEYIMNHNKVDALPHVSTVHAIICSYVHNDICWKSVFPLAPLHLATNENGALHRKWSYIHISGGKTKLEISKCEEHLN